MSKFKVGDVFYTYDYTCLGIEVNKYKVKEIDETYVNSKFKVYEVGEGVVFSSADDPLLFSKEELLEEISNEMLYEDLDESEKKIVIDSLKDFLKFCCDKEEL